MAKQYEYVYETKDKLHARMFDTETQTSQLFSFPKSQWVPPLYIPNKDGEFTSHVKGSMKLKEYTFSSQKEYKDFFDRYEDSQAMLHGNKSIVQNFIRKVNPKTEEANHAFRGWHLDIETRNVIKDIQFNIKADKALEEISLIQFYDTYDKEFYLLATKDYDFKYTTDLGKINFIVYESEFVMLRAFVSMLKEKDPLFINGFNTYMFDYPYIIKRMRKLGLSPEEMSPVGIIKEKPATNKDNIEYTHYDIVGRILLDYRELYLKYSFNRLPRYNLESICNSELGAGKVNHDEFTDFEDFYINDYGTFLEYGNRDIELLILLENKLRLIETAKSIAYLCGVNVPDVFGTYKQWHSLVYNTALREGIVLPIKQQYRNESDGFPGGWVVSKPGNYEWIISFDYNSLYPKTAEAMNYGLDTLVKPEEEPNELKELRKKYFSWYNLDNCLKLKEETNNHPEEHAHMKFMMDNKEEIHAVLAKYDVSASPNGYFYRRGTQSLFGGLMGKLYDQRLEAKANMKKYEALYNEAMEEDNLEKAHEYQSLVETNDLSQYVTKILINSAFGSLSMEINAFSHGQGFSTAITSGGRFANRWANHYLSNFLAKVNGVENTTGYDFSKQCDTDSGYVDISSLVNKKIATDGREYTLSEKYDLVNKLSEKVLYPHIQNAINDVSYLLNARDPSCWIMEQETIAEKFVSVADKRYFCRGLKRNKKTKEIDPYFKITGLSLIGKSTPPYCKDKLEPVLDLVLDTNSKEVVDYIENIREDFDKQPIHTISVIKGVSSIDYDEVTFKKMNENGKYLTAPIHSRGAIIHNKFVRDKKLSYPAIVGGDKVYYTYLRLPNPIMSDVISYNDPRFMEESGLIAFVDYKTLFEKNFKKNIELITEPIGWSLDPYQGAMDDWA